MIGTLRKYFHVFIIMKTVLKAMLLHLRVWRQEFGVAQRSQAQALESNPL